MIACFWLPELELWNGNTSNWVNYENGLYNIFYSDFISSFPFFMRNKVQIRRHPMIDNREEAFYHVTCKDYFHERDRQPDLRRCERIRWVRKFIENNKTHCKLIDCSGIKMWNKPFKNTHRTHILLEEERYIVVLEKRDTYYLLITAHYLDADHSLRKKVAEYEKYK